MRLLFWRKQHVGNEDRETREREVCEAFAEIERRDEHVRELTAELREAKRRNHFSFMVGDAIRRAKEV